MVQGATCEKSHNKYLKRSLTLIFFLATICGVSETPHTEPTALVAAWNPNMLGEIYIDREPSHEEKRAVNLWWSEVRPGYRAGLLEKDSFYWINRRHQILVRQNNARFRAAMAGAFPWNTIVIPRVYFEAIQAENELVKYGDDGEFTIFLSIGA